MTMPRAAKKFATPLHEVTATEIVAAIAAGKATCEAVTRACLERIAAREPQVQAWQYHDPEQLIAQARALDGIATSCSASHPSRSRIMCRCRASVSAAPTFDRRLSRRRRSCSRMRRSSWHANSNKCLQRCRPFSFFAHVAESQLH